MNFQCKVKIVDAIMGRGKSQAIINYINSSDKDENFLVITPYLDEVKRYKTSCKSKRFAEPKYNNGTKLEDLKELFRKGRNIVSTHALFQKFDNEIVDICKSLNYTLIMDEVADVVESYDISKKDCGILLDEFVTVDEETKQLVWREDQKNYPYCAKYGKEKKLCELGSLVLYHDTLMVWLFPINVFNSFNNIFILTYMFKAQLQRYYYDYYELPYTYMYVTGDNIDNFGLIDYRTEEELNELKKNDYNADYKSLIHILDNEKMNQIGDDKYALSKTWYERNKDNILMKTLKNNTYNYFMNFINHGTKKNIWTTYIDYKNKLKGNGYTKGFISCSSRATNEYKDRDTIAYLVNRYINPYVKNFFVSNKIKIDEDSFALSEMLQFIWRSAIREYNEIWIYIPSRRMRELLSNWIEEQDIVYQNSLKLDNIINKVKE